jgi:hypothetical protein
VPRSASLRTPAGVGSTADFRTKSVHRITNSQQFARRRLRIARLNQVDWKADVPSRPRPPVGQSPLRCSQSGTLHPIMQRADRRPGRPPLDRTTASASVHLRLSSRQYDEIYEQARQARLSVPEFIRRRLSGDACDDDDDER